MIQRLITFGLNAYDGAPLRGCVADSHRIVALAHDRWGFANGEVLQLLDASCSAANMQTQLRKLVALPWAGPGDRLFIHYSGHGTQVRDTSGDEQDHLDETLCPIDFDFHRKDTWLTDDAIASILTPLPGGVNVTLIIDACHSGTLLRNVPFMTPSKTRYRRYPLSARQGSVLDYPPKKGWRSWLGLPPKVRAFGDRLLPRTEAVLLSATTSRQLAADAFIENTFQGAHTYALGWALATFGDGLTYAQLRNRMRKWLNQNGYGGTDGQTPQLQGSTSARTRKAFAPF